ncbi:hypothetical protein AMI01nite_53920 [Aneurinibacillus migulanus]|nr:hypothetical protein AMI01nite_53920 [Aneurinibacillus migulanus]
MDSRKEKGATTGMISLTMPTEAPAMNIHAAESASTFPCFNINERAWGRVHFL